MAPYGNGAGLGELRGGLMSAMLELPADDDDAMVEIAILLSLHDGPNGRPQGTAPAPPGPQDPRDPIRGALVGRLQGLSWQVLHSVQVLAQGGALQPDQRLGQKLDTDEWT